jgi:hypothetical protein
MNCSFNKHYGAYIDPSSKLGLQALSGQRNPLLTSVACLIASRFIPDFPRSTVHAMYGQVRGLVANTILEVGPLSFDTIQALMLLSTWRPTIQSEAHFDNWILTGIAASHAVISFRLEEFQPPLLEDRKRQVRLWSRLCLIHLQ